MTELADLVARANTGDLDACRDLYVRAGAGCIEAQRALRDHMLDNAGPMNDRWAETLLEALMLTRLIAARGNRADRHRLAGLMFCLAVEHRRIGDLFQAGSAAFEGLGLLRSLADEGDGAALKWLSDVAPHWPEPMAAVEAAANSPEADRPAPHPLPWSSITTWAGAFQPDVTAVPPPLVTTVALPDATRRERFAIWCDDLRWRVRMKWWDFLDSLKGGC